MYREVIMLEVKEILRLWREGCRPSGLPRSWGWTRKPFVAHILAAADAGTRLEGARGRDRWPCPRGAPRPAACRCDHVGTAGPNARRSARRFDAGSVKRVLRLIIEDVTLLKGKEPVMHIRFRGGASRTLTVPRPAPREP